MTTLDLSSDFPSIADALEPLLLRRPGSAVGQSLMALRRAVTTREADASGGKYLASDVVWHLPAAQLAAPPQAGDRLIDAAGAWWTVLTTEHSAVTARWACQTRALAIVAGLNALISVERARWKRDQAGAPCAAWQVIVAGLPARIQPASDVAEHRSDALGVRRLLEITLADAAALAPGDRITDAAGNQYRVARLRLVGRIDVLPVLEVEQLLPAASALHHGDSECI